MSNTSEHNSKQSTEYESSDESSQGSSEYHSRQEPESERQQIILVNHNEMPLQFPKPYIQLNELMSHIDTIVPKSYNGIPSIARHPQCALGYIIHHFNINKVSWNICSSPSYMYDQVYFLTYIDTSQYNTLQCYYKYSRKQFEDALVQEQLELQIKYGKYLTSDEIPIYFLDCFL